METIEDIVRGIMERHELSMTSNPNSQDTNTTETASQTPEPSPYRCDKCHDMGLWEPEYGKGWVVCDCQKLRKAEARIKNSGLEGEIREKTFKNFSIEHDWQKTMKDRAIAYGKAYMKARNAGGKQPWFFIAGQPGCGKTHICTALCGAMLKKEIPVYYMQWVTESRRLRALANDPNFDSMLWQYTDIDILYIDDLFKQQGHQEIRVTDAEAKVLFEILNTRYIQNKATIISTEWYLETELMAVDDGTFSRVYERAKGYTVSIERGSDKNFRIQNLANEEDAAE